MAKLPNSFDWRTSPGHIALLKAFSRPRSLEQVLNWQYLRQEVPEPVTSGIERLKGEGALISSSLEEKVSIKFRVPELKNLLQARGVKGVEGKDALVKSLIDVDRVAAESSTESLDLLKCSEIGLKAIKDFDEEREQAERTLQAQEMEALINDDPALTFKLHKKYMRAVHPNYVNYYGGEHLGFLFTQTPRTLEAQFGKTGAGIIRAIAGMKQLWYGVPITQWVPDGFEIERETLENAVELFQRYAELRERISNWKPDIVVKLAFPEGDLQICDHCRRLNGKALKVSELLDWPFPNCENEIGCVPEFDWSRQSDDREEEDVETEEVDFPLILDPLDTLRQLKAMMDEGLITEEEYQEKKKEVLSKM